MTTQQPFFLSLILALTGATVLGGCVEKSRDLTRSERERLDPFVTEEDTDPEHELNIAFEDKIDLIGYDLSSDTWRPGQPLTITWHWKVNRSLEEGWKLFTHVTDASGANRVNADMEGVVRELYQPGAWKAGETVRDEQTITLPAEWSDSRASVYVGLWNGPHRLRITSGPSDGENRARGLTIPTPQPAGGEAPEAAPTPDVPSIDVNRASDITIDGKLEEPEWRSAQATPAFVNTMDGSAAGFGVTAKLLWDDDNLYVGFVVDDDHLKSAFTERDDHLWEADTVEVMLDPGGDGRNYFELQVSPQNVVFDTRYDTRRNPGPIGHADWDADIETGVDLDGTVNDSSDDEGYTVEMAIAWSSFDVGTPPASRPEAGQVWRANLYVMDARDEGSRAAAWSPPRVGDFHVPNRFGNLRFVDPSAARQPSAAAAVGMAPSKLQLPPGVAERLRRSAMDVVPNTAEQRQVNRPQAGEPVPTPNDPRPGQ